MTLYIDAFYYYLVISILNFFMLTLIAETRKIRNYAIVIYGEHAVRIDVSPDWQIFSTSQSEQFFCWCVDAFFISLVCEIRLKIHPAHSSVRTSLSFLFARPLIFPRARASEFFVRKTNPTRLVMRDGA